MLQKLYFKILTISGKRFAPLVLCIVAFLESVIFPIPPDVLLIPMSLAHKHRSLFFAGLATIFSVLGGIVGYLLGFLFWNEIGKPLTQHLGYAEAYSSLTALYTEFGILIVVIGALTPFPFKIIAILSGALEYPLINFLIAATFSRGLRFYIIGIIIFVWGNKIDHFIKNYLRLISITIAIVLIGAYFLFK